MRNIIKRETEGKVIEMLVDASYVPCFESLREMGYNIPDLRFMFVFLPNTNIEEFAEIYVSFDNYGEQHFIVGLGNPKNGEDFMDLLKRVALNEIYDYEDSQKELLADLDDADLIFEELKFDDLDEDCEYECSCNGGNLPKNEIVNMEKYKTLYATLNPMLFPTFALLMSSGFELPAILCRVEFTNNHSDKRIGTCIKFSYKFDGYGDFCLIRSLPVKNLDEEITPALLTELAYELVEDVPAFYFNLIKNLPHAKCIVKKLEEVSKIFDSISSTAKLNLK